METEREMVDRAINETKSALKKVFIGLVLILVIILFIYWLK